MAIFRLEAKIIGRRAKDKAGKPIPGRSVSVVAKAAYRAGQKLHDERTDRTYNYRSRAQEVVHTEIVAPDDAPSWLKPESGGADAGNPRERLWNEIERAERRVDSQLAREFVISLPVELEREQQVELLRLWCRNEVTAQGFVADFAVHKSSDGHNPHGHVLCTLRPVEGEGFGKKPDMTGKFHERGAVGHGAKSELEGWRSSWEILCNEALERAGHEVRIDHRSLKDQGIDREPEPKIGVEATAMQRRGASEDPDRVRDARQVRMRNELLGDVRSVEMHGETAAGEETELTWWARLQGGASIVWSEFREYLRDESSGTPGARRAAAQERVEGDAAAPASSTQPAPSGPAPAGRDAGIEPDR